MPHGTGPFCGQVRLNSTGVSAKLWRRHLRIAPVGEVRYLSSDATLLQLRDSLGGIDPPTFELLCLQTEQISLTPKEALGEREKERQALEGKLPVCVWTVQQGCMQAQKWLKRYGARDYDDDDDIV